MKKSIAFALILSALVTSLCASFGDEPEKKPEDTKEKGSEQVTEPADTEAPRAELGLEKKDWGGKTYTIATYTDESGNDDYVIQLMPEKETGETVDDAVFKRNSRLMEEYNFELAINLYDKESWSWAEYANKLIMSGEDFAQLIYGHVVYSPNVAVSGHYVNLYDVPNLNFSDPWWPKQSVNEMTVFDCMLTCASPMTYDQLRAAKVVLFNKQLLESHDATLPYEFVDKGTWTLDKLIEETKGYYSDNNLDGIVNVGDQFGYTTQPVQNGFFVSCNAPILKTTEDGGKEIAVMSERTVGVVEKLYDWYYTSGDVYLGGLDGADDFFIKEFANGNGAYSFAKLRDIHNYLRSSNIHYGVVPQPKYDEAQEDYFVFACPNLFSVPQTCQDLDFAGYIFNVMSYEGYYEVAPAYYNNTVQGKYADTEDDIRMLKLINDNLTVSFAYCYDNWEGFAHLLGAIGFSQTEGVKDMSSFYEKRLKSAENRLTKVLDAFGATEE